LFSAVAQLTNVTGEEFIQIAIKASQDVYTRGKVSTQSTSKQYATST